MSTQPTDPKPDGSQTFEQAMQRLEDIVRRLESGDIPLEESIRAYEEGARLKLYCERTLADAQMRVEKITLREDGAPIAADADLPF